MSFRAYPLAWATNAALRQAARRWQRRGLLAPPQQAAIEAACPLPYYRPGSIWQWLLLFGGTYFAVVSAGGTAALFTEATLRLHIPASLYALLAAGACAALLELVVRTQRHYYSGVDNALLYGALGAWQLCWVLWADALAGYPDTLAHAWLVLAPSLLALLLALARYADPLVAATAFAAALALLGRTLLASRLGASLLPFAAMLAAGALLLVLRPVPRRADYFYYRAACLTLRALGLAVLYLAGNYLVVREGNAALLGGGGPSREISFAPVFWVLTFAVPLLYLGLALRRPDRLLLWLGLLALAFSIFTVRTYHAVLPPAVAATLAGALLLAGALATLRYLRRPRHGLTAAADEAGRPPVNLESFLTLETAPVSAAPAPGFGFGGGSSGGGGAEGQF